MEATPLEQLLREAPDDLAAWSAYSDVLLEKDDARSRLIELELRLTREVRVVERESLQSEIDLLTEEHQESWDAELPEGVEAVARCYGFATKVAVDWSPEAPARIAEALQGRFVTRLRIRPGTAAQEADDEHWSDEPDFDEDDMPLPLPPHEADGFADLDLGGIRELDLSYFRIGDPGANGLAAAASAGRVATLDLRYCGIGSDGAAALAASGKFGDVRRLHFQRNRLTGEGVRALACFERIEELDLRYNQIGADGAQALIEAPFAGSLKRLLLHRQDVSEAGVKKLASAPQLPTALRSFWRSM
ncbi:hypothetical protein [Streptomyces sp. NPDC088748]|uniref:hypothetical protein n=1 Tax=Streptomyces sp. NPDC088748 TaxID=3365887 RepID=UPI00382E76E7